jgi:hypothetical protein
MSRARVIYKFFAEAAAYFYKPMINVTHVANARFARMTTMNVVADDDVYYRKYPVETEAVIRFFLFLFNMV